MAAFNKFHQFSEDLAKGVHNFASHTFKILLTNTAPVATNSVKADLTEITAQNGYSAGGVTVTNITAEQTTGVTSIATSDPDPVFTASGGSFGPARYAVFYNDTASGDPLIGWWDRGSSVTPNAPDTFTVDLAAGLICTIT